MQDKLFRNMGIRGTITHGYEYALENYLYKMKTEASNEQLNQSAEILSKGLQREFTLRKNSLVQKDKI